MIQTDHHGQSEDRHQPVLPGTVGFTGSSSGHIIYGCRIQGKTDGEYYRSGNDRGKQNADFFNCKADKDGYDTADDLRP